jgi:predicted metalloendopeptidase
LESLPALETAIIQCPVFNKAFEDESFRFSGKVLAGRKEQLPRLKRVTDTENSLMGELLGQLFVKEYFSPAAKLRYTMPWLRLSARRTASILPNWIG